MRHNLKLDERWFDAVREGRKKAEIRRADRDFQVGDEAVLYLRDESRALLAEITDVLRIDEVPGCDCHDFVSLSIEVQQAITDSVGVREALRLGCFG